MIYIGIDPDVDKRELELTFNVEPEAKQSFRIGKTIKTKSGRAFATKYQPKAVTDYKRELQRQARNQLDADFEPFSKAVIVKRLEFRFPPLKSFSLQKKGMIKKSDYDSAMTVFKTTKPDMDNLEKSLWDALNGLVFADDALICAKLTTMKRYSETPGIYLLISGE